MDYRFVKMNPGGNTTVLILDPVPREKQKEISVEIMGDTSLSAEQVGFLETPVTDKAVARLQMMGGEFCGNATRCLAAWAALGGLREGRPSGFPEKQKHLLVEVSGHEGVLSATVVNNGSKSSCFVSVEMPLPLEIRHGENDLFGRHSIVIFEGIIHIILWDRVRDEKYVEIAKDYLQKKNLSDSCIGIMFYESATNTMTPVVYVKDVDSLVWESSCGSGAVALASAMAAIEGRSIENLQIRQPGGFLLADILWDKGIKRVRLAGDIKISALGTVFVD
ncbi:diaminopimelate epimerase [Bacillota bacterium]